MEGRKGRNRRDRRRERGSRVSGRKEGERQRGRERRSGVSGERKVLSESANSVYCSPGRVRQCRDCWAVKFKELNDSQQH